MGLRRARRSLAPASTVWQASPPPWTKQQRFGVLATGHDEGKLAPIGWRSARGKRGDYGQIFLTKAEDGTFVGLAVGEAKLFLKVPSDLLVLLARWCLEAVHASPSLLSTDRDLRQIRDLLITDEALAAMKADAEADRADRGHAGGGEDRQAAIALGREARAKEWAEAVAHLAEACKMKPGVERDLELERLAPFVKKAREVWAG